MIALVNYGMGNLRSVQKGLERVGYEAIITDDPQVVAKSERVILPGVGASADALQAVRERGLEDPIKEFVNSGRPFLGICLGLQLLFETSYEDGEHQGLGILPGKVIPFDIDPALKVPHMGWNQVHYKHKAPIYEGIADQSHFYFVHGYHVETPDDSIIATVTDYGGQFCSSVWRDNLFATQFHPEKSQTLGLQILKNFAELVPTSV